AARPAFAAAPHRGSPGPRGGSPAVRGAGPAAGAGAHAGGSEALQARDVRRAAVRGRGLVPGDGPTGHRQPVPTPGRLNRGIPAGDERGLRPPRSSPASTTDNSGCPTPPPVDTSGLAGAPAFQPIEQHRRSGPPKSQPVDNSGFAGAPRFQP